jgi:hypothetical protein
MNYLFRIFDLYKKPITLPIKSHHIYSNITGFLASLITYIAFGIHFYFESYEVFAREHPNVLSNKNNINFSQSSSLRVSNETFRFFITLDDNDSYNKTDNLLSYFEIHSYFTTAFDEERQPIKFTECTSNDLSNFSKHTKNAIPGIKLCPRIDFSIPVNSLKEFELTFDIKECEDETKGCKRNPEFFYESLKISKKIYSRFAFMDFRENMLNFTNPFEYDVRYLGVNTPNTSLNVKLKGSEIKTQSLFGFYETESHLEFSKHSYSKVDYSGVIFRFTISFNPKDMTFYQRIYKTFTGAFSNTYSLFKLYSWLFSIFLNIHYSYNINNIIINTNFDYESSLKNSNNFLNRRNSLSSSINEADLSRKEFLKESKFERAKSKSLTVYSIYKNVSCWRFLICKRKNLTKKFYESSLKLINKHLSIEQLFIYLIEFTRGKNYSMTNCLKTERLVLDLTSNLNSESPKIVNILTKNHDDDIINAERVNLSKQ